eukprot:CAMPEP_0194039322 /NCGR_PEP_ID=MMETSP0009_2-20130614/11475_1 /TAXON_ID=210454 /ORGANISM="Grammatophora oceanica, Strain CCMP 410" /LENGTH=44 /DNA_ID= /DNA_START= /DNA_END= /DNA_ORIENTATION=
MRLKFVAFLIFQVDTSELNERHPKNMPHKFVAVPTFQVDTSELN